MREGGSSNVFAVMDGVLRTHPLNNRILGGITRLYTSALGAGGGLPGGGEGVHFGRGDLSAAAGCEVFTASTPKDILPVVKIGADTVGDGRPGPVTLALLDMMRHEQALFVGLEPPAPLAPQPH